MEKQNELEESELTNRVRCRRCLFLKPLWFMHKTHTEQSNPNYYCDDCIDTMSQTILKRIVFTNNT